MYCETANIKVKCFTNIIKITVDGLCPICDNILKFSWQGNPLPITKIPEFKNIHFCEKCRKIIDAEPAPMNVGVWWLKYRKYVRREVLEVFQEDQHRFYSRKGEKKGKKRKKPMKKKPCLFLEI